MKQLQGEVSKVIEQSALPKKNKKMVLKRVMNKYTNTNDKATQTMEPYTPQKIRKVTDPMIYAYSYEPKRSLVDEYGEIRLQNSISDKQDISQHEPVKNLTPLQNPGSIKKGKIMKGSTLQFANNLKSSYDGDKFQSKK